MLYGLFAMLMYGFCSGMVYLIADVHNVSSIVGVMNLLNIVYFVLISIFGGVTL